MYPGPGYLGPWAKGPGPLGQGARAPARRGPGPWAKGPGPLGQGARAPGPRGLGPWAKGPGPLGQGAPYYNDTSGTNRYQPVRNITGTNWYKERTGTNRYNPVRNITGLPLDQSDSIQYMFEKEPVQSGLKQKQTVHTNPMQHTAFLKYYGGKY